MKKSGTMNSSTSVQESTSRVQHTDSTPSDDGDESFDNFFTAPSTPVERLSAATLASTQAQKHTVSDKRSKQNRRPRGRLLQFPKLKAPLWLAKSCVRLTRPHSADSAAATQSASLSTSFSATANVQITKPNLKGGAAGGISAGATTHLTTRDLQNVALKLKDHITDDNNNNNTTDNVNDNDNINDNINDNDKNDATYLCTSSKSAGSTPASDAGSDASNTQDMDSSAGQIKQKQEKFRAYPVPVQHVSTGDEEWHCVSRGARTLMSLVWNSKFVECEAYIDHNNRTTEATLARLGKLQSSAAAGTQAMATRLAISHGSGFYSFLTAVLTFEDEDVEHAMQALSNNEKLIGQMMKEAAVAKWKAHPELHAQQVVDSGLNLRKMNLDMLKADTLLLNGVIYLFQGKVSAYMKAAYSLRRGFKEFESVLHTIKTHNKGALLQHIHECDAANAAEPTMLHVNQTELQSVYHGAMIGLNICIFMISLLPPRAKSFVAMVGIKGNRYDALDALRDGTRTGSYKAAISGFVLALCLSELIKYVEPRVPHRIVMETAGVVNMCIDNFPDSNLFRMMRAKNLRARGLYRQAINEMSSALAPPVSQTKGNEEQAEGKQPQQQQYQKHAESIGPKSGGTGAAQSVQNACQWELCTIHLAAGSFSGALRNLAPMLATTKRPQTLAFYAFLISYVLYELDYEEKYAQQQQQQQANADASDDTRRSSRSSSSVTADLDVLESLIHARDRIDSQAKKDPFNQMMLRRVLCLIEAHTTPDSEARLANRLVPYSPVYEILYYWNEMHETSEDLASRTLLRLEGAGGGVGGGEGGGGRRGDQDNGVCWSASEGASAVRQRLVQNNSVGSSKIRPCDSVLLIRTVLFYVVTGRARLVRCHSVLRALVAAPDDDSAGISGSGFSDQQCVAAAARTGAAAVILDPATMMERLWQDIEIALTGLTWCLQFQGKMPVLENYLVGCGAFELGVFALAVSDDYCRAPTQILSRIATLYELKLGEAGLIGTGAKKGVEQEDEHGMAGFAKIALEVANKIMQSKKSAEMGGMMGGKTRGGLAQLSGQARRL